MARYVYNSITRASAGFRDFLFRQKTPSLALHAIFDDRQLSIVNYRGCTSNAHAALDLAILLISLLRAHAPDGYPAIPDETSK